MSEPAFLRALPAPSALQLRGAPGGLLVLTLPGVMRFDALRLAMRDLFTESPGRFKGARVRLELGARELDLLEIRRLIHMTKDEFDIEVVGLSCDAPALQRMAERELKLKIAVGTNVPPDPESLDAPEPGLKPTDVKDVALVDGPMPGEGVGGTFDESSTSPALFAVDPDNLDEKTSHDRTEARIGSGVRALKGPNFETEDSGTDIVSPPGDDTDEQDADLGGRTLTVNNTLRSGACVRFGGDVTIFGDVNPGAQVIAGGNIVVLGALKGMAHAGTREESAVILAFDLRPTQLRIGKVIGVVPGADPDKAGRSFLPEMASVSGSTIVVEPYRGKLPASLHHSPKETPA